MKSPNKLTLLTQTWAKASMHAKASKVGIPSNLEHFQTCPCCDQAIQKEPIPLTQHIKQLQIFGFGYPLWFQFIKCCIFLVLILIVSKTSSQLYQATQQNYNFCFTDSDSIHNLESKQHGNKNQKLQRQHIFKQQYRQKFIHLRPVVVESLQSSKIESQSSLVQREQNVQQEKQHHHAAECTSFMVYFSLFKQQRFYSGYFLRVIQFLIHLIALIGIRNSILKKQQYYDERTTSLSDFSIIVSNLPSKQGNRHKLQQLFEHQFGMYQGHEHSQIKQIIYIFKDSKLHQLEQRKKQLLNTIIEKINQQNYQQVQRLQKQQNLLNKQQQNLSQTILQAMKQDKIICNKFIIVFNSQQDKAHVMNQIYAHEQSRNRFLSYFYDDYNSQQRNKVNKQNKIVFKQAPQPNQIIWEHIDQSDSERKGLVMHGYLMTFAFLFVLTVIFYFIMLAKTKLFINAIQMEYHDPDSQKAKHFKALATVIVFLALFGVVLFNKFIMGKVLHKFVHGQKHAFADRQNYSFAIKYAIGMFFTTALMTLAVEAITFKNFYSHQFGVIEQQTIMFFVTAFFIPLVWAIHPYNLVRRLKLKMNKQKQLIPQQQANQLSQNFPYDLGKRYAQMFQIMWFTFLYSQLIPLGSFLVLIGLSLYYWVDKYNFLRRSTIKTGISGKMTILALKALDVTLFLSPSGQFLFNLILNNQFDLFALCLASLGIIYLFVPISRIIWYLNQQKFMLQQKTYQQVKYIFKQTYYTLNPVYKLTHKSKLQKYKKRYVQHYLQQLKVIKLYGAGRGTYKTDTLTTIQRQSRKNKSLNVSSEGNKSRLLRKGL